MAAVSDEPFAYVRRLPAERLPPPLAPTGALGWLRANLFSSPANIALTLLCVLFIAWAIPPLVRFFLIDAVWSGADREACLATPEHPAVGACWAFVRVWFSYFVYGFYPAGQRWRVDLFFIALAFGIVWLLRLSAPRRDLGALYFFVVLPVLSFVLLHGAPPIGLAVVPTALWGGMLVTVIVATVGIVFSLPLGILLALGRRSDLPVVRLLSVIFIEFVRGVPLITVLFMASVMLPLFVPDRLAPDKLVRALVGVAMFASAYMAEVVRGGLQGVASGQEEAAASLGLRWWHAQAFIVLPQALRIIVPGIINTVVDLFKDTTLLTIIGLFDLLGTVEQALKDPAWLGFATEGYVFSAIVFFVCCYAMSAYGRNMERRLAKGQ